jgi:cytochrome bd-I ubiquinol oxidase subunit X
MWYFSWILGLGLALTFGVLNAIWYEVLESQREQGKARQEPSSTEL